MKILTWDEVVDIRWLYSLGETQETLAKIYNTPQANISSIILRKTFKKSPDERAKHSRMQRLATEHGITIEEVRDLEDWCRICGERETGRWGTLHIDHDHETDEVRGRLCSPCNRAIGAFDDSPSLLRAAAIYLEGGL